MCQRTYEYWYDNYYKFQLDKYPSWQTLYDIYMNFAQNVQTYNYIKGFVAIESGGKMCIKVYLIQRI